MTEGFAITGSRGFHITFTNGVTVSVQFGGGLHCDNYDIPVGAEHCMDKLISPNAEVAVFNGKVWLTKQYPKKEDDDTLEYPSDTLGYQSPEDVLRLLNWAADYGS